jgi:chromosome partitioning protein
MKTRCIAFINFKGGVGKTASVVNLGATLAKYHDKRVLIVDLDPQCNSSLWLLQPSIFRAHTQGGRRSTFQIFEDQVMGTHLFDFEEAMIPGVPHAEYPLIAKLDLLPGAVELLRVEDKIHQNKYASNFYTFLQRALKPHFAHYDYVLFDCPPNLYSVTKNALFATDYCHIPFVPDYLSLSGFQILAEEIELFYDRVSGQMTGRKRPKIASLMVSHYRASGNVYAHAINELELQLAQLIAVGQVHPKTAILTPYVRHNVAVAESTNVHLPVILHKPNSDGALDYAQLAENFLKHYEETL